MAAKRRRAGYEVFVSHAYKDRWIARHMVKEMESTAKGRVAVFLDEKDIEVGRPIAKEVREAIERCDEFVVLLTPNSKGREWVLLEMGAAWGLKKPIVVILHDLSPDQMPDITYQNKAIHLNDFDEIYIRQLQRRLGKGQK